MIDRQSAGLGSIPVTYAPVRVDADPLGGLVVALPLIVEQREIAEEGARVGEMILLATVALVAMLALSGAGLARTVSRPVRDLVGATGRIASGEYSARLRARTHDELADLVDGFNVMASSLARQRADLERRRDYIETLLRHATAGVVSLDAEGRVVTLNPAAEALLADCADRLSGGADLVEVLAGSVELEPVATALLARRPDGVPTDVDLVGDAGPRRLRLVRVALRRASGESFGTMILIDDVTDMMRSNQFAAWAEMARVIAHEIKNPLTPIQLSTEHLKRLLEDRGTPPTPDEFDACLETIIKQVRALYEIAGEFSTYAQASGPLTPRGHSTRWPSCADPDRSPTSPPAGSGIEIRTRSYRRCCRRSPIDARCSPAPWSIWSRTRCRR